MNKHIKEWIAALRSGKYKQGRGQLCKILPDGSKEFCCLGVLCEDQFPNLKKDIDATNAVVYEGCRGFVPQNVRNAFPKRFACIETILTNLNDKLNYSFDEIADYIEKEFLTSE